MTARVCAVHLHSSTNACSITESTYTIATRNRAICHTLQVIESYCKYADSMVGRWSVKDDGYQTPSLRVLLKPLYNMFHGERGGRKWKAAMDESLRTDPSITTLTELVNRTLHHVDPSALSAAPCTVSSTFEPFTAEQTGVWPPDDVPGV